MGRNRILFSAQSVVDLMAMRTKLVVPALPADASAVKAEIVPGSGDIVIECESQAWDDSGRTLPPPEIV